MDWLFDTSGFVPRTHCGTGWTNLLVTVHEMSNTVIFLCYLLIPLGLVSLYSRVKRGEKVENPAVGIAMLVLFVVTCGLTHLCDRLMFSWPVYRLTGLVLFVCAASSLAMSMWLFWPRGQVNGR